MFHVLLPLAVVQTLSVIVNTFPLLLVERPVTVVVMVRAVLVFTLPVLFAVLKIALVNWRLRAVVFSYCSPAVEEIVVELSCVLQVLLVKIVCALTVHLAVFHATFVPISVLEFNFAVFDIFSGSLGNGIG